MVHGHLPVRQLLFDVSGTSRARQRAEPCQRMADYVKGRRTGGPMRGESLWNRVVGSYPDVVSLLRAMDEHCRACAQQINNAGFDLLFVGACQFFRVTPIGPSVRVVPAGVALLAEEAP